jgi:hypothetical protein
MDWLPIWVYEVIAAIDKHEDEHAKEDACLGGVLGLIPPQQLDRARAVAYADRHRPTEETK